MLIQPRLREPVPKRDGQSDEADMGSRIFIWIGMMVGSTVGGLLPMLWGDGFISMSGMIFSGLGGLAGIWLGHKLHQQV